MEKNKGLADNGDGEIILNESGTSISTEATEVGAKHDIEEAGQQVHTQDKEELAFKTSDPIAVNDIASDENSRWGEGIIKPYDDVFGDHKPHEDFKEVSGTDEI